MEHIGSTLGKILKESGLLEGIKRQQILAAWPDMVGSEFARRSRPVRIARETLWVEAEGSSWSVQIMMVRREIVKRYRERFGELPFRDLRVTVGVFHRDARDTLAPRRGREPAETENP
jgi:predicted nucleic acid-binding Zn ribbon protein